MSSLKSRFRFVWPARGSAAWLPAWLAALLAVLTCVQFALPGAVSLSSAGVVARGTSGGAPSALPLVVVPSASLARDVFAPRAASGPAPVDPLGGAIVAGVVRVGALRYAVVQPASGGIRNVPIGGRIAGWRLDALSAGGAGLSRGAAHIAVTFGARAAAPEPTQNAEDHQ